LSEPYKNVSVDTLIQINAACIMQNPVHSTENTGNPHTPVTLAAQAPASGILLQIHPVMAATLQ
jgi:hypothetical protein